MKESETILYTTPNGEVKIDIRFEDETFWLPQQKIADLFEVDRTSISRHLSNIFKEEELQKKAVVRKFRVTAVKFWKRCLMMNELKRDVAERFS